MQVKETEKQMRGVAINPFAQIHYLDHLAPVCKLMDVPIMLTDDLDIYAAKKYYPDIEVISLPFEEFQPDLLASNYDVLYYSDLWHRDTFKQKFEDLNAKYHKKMRGVHCPHGFSDKAFYLKKAAFEDITLVYGQHMLDLFRNNGVLDVLHAYVVVGNLRYHYYKKHKEFFDKIAHEEVFSKFEKQQPIILYAPTWKDLEQTTSFFDAADELFEQLPDEYNLLVKLHPQLELNDTAAYYRILGKYEKQPNLLFIKDIPIVYPLLAQTDIYIGDASAVGYDFLVFNRPMFFLNMQQRDSEKDPLMFLTQCGTEILPEQAARNL